MRAAAKDLRRPLLILHAPGDEIVGVDHARRLFEAARHPKSYVSLDHADHLLSRAADAAQAARLIATWAAPYLPEGAASTPSGEQAPTPLPHGLVTVESGAKGFTSSVQAGAHQLLADEPNDFGGQDRGPAPFEFLLTSLGACTAMTLRMYADRKEWPLEGVHVALEREKGDKDTPDTLTRSIQLRGPLDAEQKQRLLEIAERCPVHRAMEKGFKIATVGRD